jgi:hypothetical protein
VTGNVTTKHSAALRVSAQGYGRQGLPVFPLRPRSKEPRYTGSFHNASTDYVTIRDHWRKFPTDNIGIAPPAGVVVLDVDPRAGGDAALARLVAQHGQLPETWTARTGSDGRHYWFAHGQVRGIRGKLCAGIDLKCGSKGYVVAPPSIHPNGTIYEWLVRPYGQPTIAPVWLVERMQPLPPPPLPRGSFGTGTGHGLYSLRCLVNRIAASREGNRNDTLYGALKDAFRQGDLDAFEADLVAAAVGVGLGTWEVESVVRSVRGGG